MSAVNSQAERAVTEVAKFGEWYVHELDCGHAHASKQKAGVGAMVHCPICVREQSAERVQ
jgi:hypothetical protein